MLEVLIVDDEDDIRDGIAFPLCEAGHVVTEAADGIGAVIAFGMPAPMVQVPTTSKSSTRNTIPTRN